MPSPLANSGSVSTSVVSASQFYVHPAAEELPPGAASLTRDNLPEACENPIPSILGSSKNSSKTYSSEHSFHLENAEPASYFRVKTWVDRLITAGLLLVATPLMIIVAIAVLVLDGRPIFFRQVRVGKGGDLFQIWKFRTMQRDAEASTGAVWSSAGDTRVTALGHWLRQTHLDELPQFLNVLTGDMNLIGPRPERPEFVKRLSAEIPSYDLRSQVRPGITGLAQLRLGYDESIAGVPKKVQCDLEYISGTSFVRDFGLLAKTVPHITLQLVKSRLAKIQKTIHPVKKSLWDDHSTETISDSRLYIHPAQALKKERMSASPSTKADSEVA
ncbi:putative undecaprenyl-phosphate N-acetylgalactosaminyl 1-phosphate transferase [Rubripirellula obstinata]|uniref:Putative undecaprenyl-phosphate N-acetylgalactosaminyl 1-phosphate transferase n=1 Tax=Rubripirellula obstinata TaxID=406547 RepID=A0A5B1CKG0_9BACT|nr:sugar transferase [Rubripirellula obstinata]KAA1261548.1 putative undecaprenyl-phosphate N-acetylgalactosaminyl 1-phosphate transferase [Rubripirellula obstinata]